MLSSKAYIEDRIKYLRKRSKTNFMFRGNAIGIELKNGEFHKYREGTLSELSTYVDGMFDALSRLPIDIENDDTLAPEYNEPTKKFVFGGVLKVVRP